MEGRREVKKRKEGEDLRNEIFEGKIGEQTLLWAFKVLSNDLFLGWDDYIRDKGKRGRVGRFLFFLLSNMFPLKKASLTILSYCKSDT